MLIQFTIENFLSFKEENTLNMLATTDSKHKHHLLPNKKKKPLLRTAILYGANGSGKSNLIRAMAFAQDLIVEGTRPNNLFLHELYEKNVPKIMPLIDWFRSVLIIIGPESNYRDLIFDGHMNGQFLQFMGDFLKAADTGVDGIVSEKVEFDFEKLFPGIPEPLKSKLTNISANERILLSVPDGRRFAMMREQSGELTLLKLKARHHLKDAKEHIDFEIEDESDGTRRLMDLLPALLHSKSSEKVYLIDEIDRSMHPLLSRMFLESYLNDQDCGRGQLIITTHESQLLDRNLLRRDEIWFSEQDKNGGSHLYSLSEYKVRNDLKLEKGYLDGRFGAIPFLGDLETLPFCRAGA